MPLKAYYNLRCLFENWVRTSDLGDRSLRALPLRHFKHAIQGNFVANYIAIPIPRVELGTQGYEPYVLPFHYIGVPFKAIFLLQLLLLYQYPESNWELRVMSPTFYRFTILESLLRLFFFFKLYSYTKTQSTTRKIWL